MKNLKLELNLFDGEIADAGAPDMVDLQSAADAQPQKDNLSSVPDSKDAEFEKLIKGEYKKEFEQRMMDNLKRRFKDNSLLQKKASQSDEIINILKKRYGITTDDMGQIADAIKNDDGYLKAEAEKQGVDPDMLKRVRELEFENESMKRRISEEKKELEAHTRVNQWLSDAALISETHPDFDLETEVQNPRFAKMLRAGIDLKSAYYAVHHEDIVNSLVEKASHEASVRITDSIRARGARPNENGLSGQSSAIIKTDVSRLTPKERADIARRVREGEEISF